MAPATQHPGLLQSREGWWKYGGTRGSTRKSLRPPPNSPHPADLEEPLLLLRADMAAGLARLGIWVLGSCHSPSLPSSYPSRPHPTPSNYPRATHPSLGSQSSLQAEMCPITRQYQTTGFLYLEMKAEGAWSTACTPFPRPPSSQVSDLPKLWPTSYGP